METMSFKTNAKCMGCLTKIEEILEIFLNHLKNIHLNIL